MKRKLECWKSFSLCFSLDIIQCLSRHIVRIVVVFLRGLVAWLISVIQTFFLYLHFDHISVWNYFKVYKKINTSSISSLLSSHSTAYCLSHLTPFILCSLSTSLVLTATILTRLLLLIYLASNICNKNLFLLLYKLFFIFNFFIQIPNYNKLQWLIFKTLLIIFLISSNNSQNAQFFILILILKNFTIPTSFNFDKFLYFFFVTSTFHINIFI